MRKIIIAANCIAFIFLIGEIVRLMRLLTDRTAYGINRMERMEVLRGILKLRRKGKRISDFIDTQGIERIGFVGFDPVCRDILQELEADGIKPSFIICDDYYGVDYGVDIYHSKTAPDADLYIIPAESDPISQGIINRNENTVMLAELLKGI